MQLRPDTDIQYLKGVGDRRASLYRKLSITNIKKLLYHLPRSYIDLRAPHQTAQAPQGIPCAVQAGVFYKSAETHLRAGLSIFKIKAADDSGQLEITIFNNKPLVDSLVIDKEYIFYGKVERTLTHCEMTSPLIFPLPLISDILPIYPQTAGMSSALMRKNIAQAIEICKLEDLIPPEIIQSRGLLSITEGVKQAHFPEDFEKAKEARRRFVYEELLVLSIAMERLRLVGKAAVTKPFDLVDITEFYRSLPFSPTNAQRRSIAEALEDMSSQTAMNRLVQGDVGSGKTLVVVACVYSAYKNTVQSAVMVPTEILAEQHYNTLSAMLEPFGARVALLTGSTPAAQKRAIYAELKAGEIDLCIGTHALLSEGVEFNRLGLVVTDEQHRFGVKQRSKLNQKSDSCNTLVLSATPIPRTLSLIIYGDLTLSTIDELPPGRKKVETFLINSQKRERALAFIAKALDEGKQGYIVCPLVEESDYQGAGGLQSAVEYADWISQNALKGYRIGVLHGKLKPKEKEETMRLFKEGEIQLLVSTTVVEVGVDVKNAVIMLVENAERFGLSQLHQLRGRVGRSSDKSYCILLSDSKSSATWQRLAVMKETSDGFEISEHDLKLRGPGDFLGFRQHGLPELHFASFADDMETMQLAQQDAKLILATDPELLEPQHGALSKASLEMISSVGIKPN